MKKQKKLQTGLLRARQENVVIIQPKGNEIQIDLDGVKQMQVFTRQLSMLQSKGITIGWKHEIVPSKTPGHCHVVITLPTNRPLKERVLLAALLGSDLKREAFNYIRTVRGFTCPVALFRRA